MNGTTTATEETTITPVPSVVDSTTPLLSGAQADAAEWGYSGTWSSATATASRKLKGPAKDIDFDATSSAGESTPGTPAHPNSQPLQDPQCRPIGDMARPTTSRKSGLWHTVWHTTSLRLENTGSVARDHLASERTFLAYIRTSLAIASSGVALVQLFSVAQHSLPPNAPPSNLKIDGFVRPLGAVAILVGISVLLIGFTRYFIVQSALTNGHFPAARSAMAYISLALAALVTATFSFLVAGKVDGP